MKTLLRAVFFYLFTFAALFLGCGGPLLLRVDPAYAPAERNEIALVAGKWNEVVKPSRAVMLRADGSWYVAKEDPPDSGFNGYTFSPEKKIWMRVHPGGDVPYYAIALHEMGHALCLGHTDSGVMMPFTVSVEFTPEVLFECRRCGACE